MADEYDVVDIVHDTIEPVCAGFVLYRDRSGDGESKNHVTIRVLALGETRVINKGQVNVNVFVRQQSKGMPARQVMKKIVRDIRSALRDMRPPLGMYWKSRIAWSESLGEAKEGFDCTNIRLEVITEKDL